LESLTIRLLPHEIADGPANMAADEALLVSMTRGQASLRFYGWSTPTLSLGYFQSHASRLADPLLAGLPFVRRPSGGDALVHHHELTYCLAVPASRPWQQGKGRMRMHDIIAAALGEFGVEAAPHVAEGDPSFEGVLCFRHFTTGDLIVKGHKVLGSAQRKQRGAVMQHGGILLATSPHTPSLPGIAELTGTVIDPDTLARAIARHVESVRGCALIDGAWAPDEMDLRAQLMERHYTSDDWNCKR
jgi:lipoate-protein ligase A